MPLNRIQNLLLLLLIQLKNIVVALDLKLRHHTALLDVAGWHARLQMVFGHGVVLDASAWFMHD